MCARVCALACICLGACAYACVSFILLLVVMLATGYEPVSTAVTYLVYVLRVRTFREGSKEPTGGPERLCDPRERQMVPFQGLGLDTNVPNPEQMIIRWS